MIFQVGGSTQMCDSHLITLPGGLHQLAGWGGELLFIQPLIIQAVSLSLTYQ